MKQLITLSAVLLAAFLIQGCSGMAVTRKSMSSTGREIDRVKVEQIVKDKTTSDEITAWFGAPTGTSSSGTRDFLTYKYCETSVSMFAGSQREDCDILTVTIDHSTQKVADYNLEEGIKKRTKF